MILKPAPSLFNLLLNKDFYLQKAELSNTILELFAFSADEIKDLINDTDFPPEIKSSSPKISRGENYLGFPWTLLDYPRFFQKPDVFALRTLCWWGNYFSITLHLSGSFAINNADSIFSSLKTINMKDYFLCINDKEWEHHFLPENYKPITECLNDLSVYKEKSTNNSFIKISRKIAFDEWENIPDLLKETATQFFSLLKR